MASIILTTINAKWIHPSLALRLLKANLGSLEDSCEIIEFALRQPLGEKIEPFLAVKPRILGISVSIWNHLAVIELLEELEKVWSSGKPVIILGGPEVSHLPPDAKIFQYAAYVIRGEGEVVFRELCEDILAGEHKYNKFIVAEDVDVNNIKTAYHLYTDEDLKKKLIYVEASRGCLFNCEFCLSAVKTEKSKVREFPLEPFFAEMDTLIQRGAKTFKFLDRSININIPRIIQVCEFFLERIRVKSSPEIVVHFEMVPSIFLPELIEILSRFPPGTLRLEIGIQTLNAEVAARISRPSNPEKELESLHSLREKTNAIIHADLIAGLPGEDLDSFGRGFDRLWQVLQKRCQSPFEIQLGILKLLPGAPISRFNETFGMQYNPLPPYEIKESTSISAVDLQRIKNFARFWELIINRGLTYMDDGPVFEKFIVFSDELFEHFGRNWGIDKAELLEKTTNSRFFRDHFI